MHLPQINIGGVSFQPELWQAGVIVLLLFFLLLTMARMRRHFLHWSFRGAIFGIFIGFALALILEGFLLLTGHTFILSVLGWKSAPTPIQNALDSGNEKLREVIGTSTTASPCPVK